jgi:hypothetical protein
LLTRGSIESLGAGVNFLFVNGLLFSVARMANHQRRNLIPLTAFVFLVLLLGVFVGGNGCGRRQTFTPPGTGAFANVRERDIVGTYRWFQNGTELGSTMLAADHSVTTYRGEKKPGYRWELQKEGLLLIWNKGFNYFSRVVSSGIYEGQKDSSMIRIEKK